MKKYLKTEFFYGSLVGMITTFAVLLVYQQIIVPWPYQEQLKACLREARALENESARETAENICFRTHPHFN